MNLPIRKSARLQGYDYSSAGAYFVTICVSDRKMLLRNLGTDAVRPNDIPPLSEYGEIVDRAINAIPDHYDDVIVDKYCIMPDHVHMIVFILSDEGGRMVSVPTLSTVVGSMKRWVSQQIGTSIWQKSFFDKIIRSEQGYFEVWQYIDNNLLKWELDEHGLT